MIAKKQRTNKIKLKKQRMQIKIERLKMLLKKDQG